MSDIKVTIGGDAREFAKVVDGVKGKLSTLGSSLGKLATLGGIGGSGMVLASSIKQIGELSDAAANVGMTVEEYQKLGFAFRDVGLSAQDMDKAVAAMNAKLGAAAQGEKSAVQNLAKLGLTYEGIKDLSPADQFEKIAKAIGKLPTIAERAAAGTEFFSKVNGKKLDQLITGYDAVISKVTEANDIISGDSADAADKLGDELAKLNDSFNALVANSGLIEFLTSVASTMDGVNKSIRDGVAAIGEMSAMAQKTGAKGVGASGGVAGFIDAMSQSGLGQYAPGLIAWRKARGLDVEQQITTSAATGIEASAFREQQQNLGRRQRDNQKADAEAEAKMTEDAKKKLRDKDDKKRKSSDDKTTDALLRIGGRIGGVGGGATPQDRTNELLQQILIATNTQTARMPRADSRSPAARGEA